ncbi:MAG: hypothetical protein ABIQ31_01235 [Ferruginibacter sp.]
MSDNDLVCLADLIDEAINLDSFIRYLKIRYDVPENISRRKVRETANFDDLYGQLRLLGYKLPKKHEPEG